MYYSQSFNLCGTIFYALGTILLGIGFWPPKSKFVVEKKKIFKGGKLFSEEALQLVEDSVADSEIPEEIKSIYKDKDLMLFVSLLKKSKEISRLKFYGCWGTGFILIGCLLTAIALFL